MKLLSVSLTPGYQRVWCRMTGRLWVMNLKGCKWKRHSCEAIIFCVEGYRRITRHIRIPDLFLVQLGLSNNRQYLRKSRFLEPWNYGDSLEPTNFPQFFIHILLSPLPVFLLTEHYGRFFDSKRGDLVTRTIGGFSQFGDTCAGLASWNGPRPLSHLFQFIV